MRGASKKPYRRFRARGSGQRSVADGLSALAAMNRTAAERAMRGGAVPARPRVVRPAPPRRPDRGRPARSRAGAAPRAGVATKRRWWSLSGIGVAGWTWRIALLLVAAVLAWGVLGYLALRCAAGEAIARFSDAARAALADPGGGLLGTPANILVVGIDSGEGRSGPARADTIMVMRTDPDAGHIRYLSIPRDLRVDLPGHGFQKINAAYAFNGQAGIIKAVSRGELGIPINHIMLIDFRGLGKLVDSLGGIDVTNPTRLVNCPYAGGRTVSFPRGHIHLNGARALEFSRVRKCDSDFERARRQQIVVAALKGKVLSFSALPMAPWRGARVVRALGTDLGAIDLAKLGWLQARLQHDPNKDEMVLAGRPENIGGQSFVILKPDQAERQLAQFVRR